MAGNVSGHGADEYRQDKKYRGPYDSKGEWLQYNENIMEAGYEKKQRNRKIVWKIIETN